MFNQLEFDCFINHLVSEHRRVHLLLCEVREAIDRHGGLKPVAEPPTPAADRFTDVVHAVDHLRRELTAHFAEEERGGCLEEAVARCPRLSQEAQRIEAEHRDLLEDASRLAEAAKVCRETTRDYAALRRRFDHFCEKIQAHEHAENRLLSEAFGMAVESEGDDKGSPAKSAPQPSAPRPR